LASVQVWCAPEEWGPVFGIIGSLNTLGVIAGLLLGGWLVTANLFGVGWRSIFHPVRLLRGRACELEQGGAQWLEISCVSLNIRHRSRWFQRPTRHAANCLPTA